ncbi:glycoside hydrolase family 99-like domain-containing protein [Duganella sp. Dugasp56]|uniref:glycoside hydrolase family 99-like domain-containing protein n=1 Tax=Duganella sp. Dugasp56 TaxID=3243046 RepID=UPI0039B0E4A9
MQSKKRQLILGAGATMVGGLLPLVKAAAATATVPTSSRTLVAAYFGGWSKPIDASQQWLDGDNPWGVYPTAAFPNVHHRMGLEEFADRYPIEGPWRADGTGGYDEKQPEFMQSAIESAHSYGVDVFAVNWYRNEFLNYPVENLKLDTASNTFKISNPEKIKWFLQWSNNSNYHSNPPSDSRDYFYEGIRLAALHMKDQPYYWTLKNKPVFAIFDVSQIDRIINLSAGRPAKYAVPEAEYSAFVASRDAFLKDCHNIVANVLAGQADGGISGSGQAVTVTQRQASFVPSMYLLVATGDVGGWASSAAVDAMYAYNIRSGKFNGVQRRATSYDEITQAAQATYDLYIPAMRKYLPKQVSWWPTLVSGYDDRPWFGSDTDPGVQQCPATDAQFQQHCSQVNRVHNANIDVTGGITFIYAWNEWGEGGWIAPSAGSGYTKLQTLKTYLKDAPAS